MGNREVLVQNSHLSGPLPPTSFVFFFLCWISWSLRIKSSVRNILSIPGAFCSTVGLPLAKAGDTFAVEGVKDLSGKVLLYRQILHVKC